MKQGTLLCTSKVRDKLWVLEESLIFWTVLHCMYTVPKDFLTDGASNIRLLWALCPPMSGKTAEPSVLHDYLYSKDCEWLFTRKDADIIYHETMIDNGVPRWRAKLIYWGVRLGGRKSFKAMHSIQKLKV